MQTKTALETIIRMAEAGEFGIAEFARKALAGMDGWQLVPVKPTYAMERNAADGNGRSTGSQMESYKIIYADMLAAAPEFAADPFAGIAADFASADMLAEREGV